MGIDKSELQGIMVGSEADRVKALCQLLGYPLHEHDPNSKRFWYLHPNNNRNDPRDTAPIAIAFYDELVGSDGDIKQFLTSQAQHQVIYKHYIEATEPPVMYILLPLAGDVKRERVALILPTVGKIRQRCIQIFGWQDEELRGRLSRLQQDVLADKIWENSLGFFVPQVDWIFYKSANTAKELAVLLAGVTRRIEQMIPLIYESEGEAGYLHKLLDSFRNELLPNLQVSSNNEKDYSFADIYAQTMAYGLFTARVFSFVKEPKSDFSRVKVWEKLPETNPFLRQLFKDISEQKAEQIGDDLIDAIAEIVSILRVAKMDAILQDFRNNMNREDIVIRFYEDFLAAYKPQMRDCRGVYYTPEPVVSYMVRSVDELIKDKFDKPLGIADPGVMILDPACGTGTFLLWIFKLIYQRFQENPRTLTVGLKDKSWNGYVGKYLLPRIFGFELLMAPYAICHLKLGLFLEETGYQFNTGERLGVYLMNTLDDLKLKKEEQQLAFDLPQMEQLIAKEAGAGYKVKKQEPIMVVIGNPPYNVLSSNKDVWMTKLIEDYKYVDGVHFKEKKHWLTNDYVKFIRFAEDCINKNDEGIVAFINPNGFLKDPTFRGMRCHLVNTFDRIDIVDLHGYYKERLSPDGVPDKNVFDIKSGVSINIFVKIATKSEDHLATVRHFDLWGQRETKYQSLLNNSLESYKFKIVSYSKPSYCFQPKDKTGIDDYENGIGIDELFINNATGIVTMGDKFIISETKRELEARLNKLLEYDYTEQELKTDFDLGKNYAKWILENKTSISIEDKKFVKIDYRPFDTRWTIFDNKLIWRWRFETMKFFVKGDNIGLVVGRQSTGDDWSHIQVTRYMIDNRYHFSVNGTASEFPLYIYPETGTQKSITQDKISNFNVEALRKIENTVGLKLQDQIKQTKNTFTSLDILNYVYAILHSPTYRRIYNTFLKENFPKVPITSNKKLFIALSKLGEQLVQLHLMTSPRLDKPITKFIKESDQIVATGHPKYINNQVYINKTDYFQNVPEEVWNFHIGGYQVCQKWLKDRKGRTLSAEDITHYQKIIVALAETIKLMEKIDKTIPSFPIE